MADANPAKNPEQTKTEKPLTTHPPAKNNKRKKASRFSLLTPLILAVSLITATYTLYINNQLKQTLFIKNQELVKKINKLKKQQFDEEQEMHAAIDTLHLSEKTLEDTLRELHSQVQTTLQQPFYQKQDWLLLKARYYLELAQINAHWSSNQEMILALLQEADRILNALSDQKLLPIRQALAQEITTLQAQPKIDIAGQLSQLDALQNLIPELPIKPSLINPTLEKTTSEHNEPLSILEKNLNFFKKLIVIHHNDNNLMPLLLSPFYQTMLRECIRFNLQEAQWAILQSNEAVYQLSLTQALKNIKKIFDDEENHTKSLMSQIHALQQHPILTTSLELNDQALTQLNQFIESKQKLIDHETEQKE